MRQLFVLLILLGVTLSSCKKNDTINPLDTRLSGKWEMISIKDDSANTLITKPSSISTDIDITIFFTASARGEISGTLTRATSVKGNFSIDRNKTIAVPAIYFSY